MMFVSDRDFVFVSHKERVGKTTYIGVRSITVSQKPPIKNVVRGQIAVELHSNKILAYFRFCIVEAM